MVREKDAGGKSEESERERMIAAAADEVEGRRQNSWNEA